MKRILFLSFLIACCIQAFSQDSIYYQTAFNSSGDTLKARLHNIIKGHTEYPYTSSSTDVWDILKLTDRDPNDSNNVILIYSNRSVDAAQEYNGGNGWNREHVWAKSRGDFGTSLGAGTDAHHLRPCDISVNSTRNNRNFDDCVNCVDIIDGTFNTGSKRDANLYTFQPPENVKGDIARMIFYMAVRYEGTGTEPDLELTDALQGSTDKAPLHAVLSTLLEWNRIDSVDAFEQNRNQVIYGFQGNKNPFIDYPELAEYLWGDSVGLVWKSAPIVNLNSPLSELIRVTQTQSFRSCFLEVPKDFIVNPPIKATLIDSFGSVLYSFRITKAKTKVSLSNLPVGVYFLNIESSKESFSKKVIRK